MSCHSKFQNFEFDKQLIDSALEKHQLLSIEIEFSRACNFRCPYCYVPDEDTYKDEMSKEESRNIIIQAQELGARRIIVLGGEPMVYPDIFEMLEFIKGRGLEAEMFTNGTNVTLENAKKLFDLGVNVVLKMNSSDKETQDELTALPGSYEIIQSALANLKAAGYPSDDPFLAISTVICKQNIGEMKDLWVSLRDQNIMPYLEMITPQGNAIDNKWLYPDSKDVEKLFSEIAKIDREEYGQSWVPQPPLAGNACLRHGFSFLVSANGDVMPCVGIPIVVGNAKTTPLKNIMEDSEVIQDLRNYKTTIKGPCGTCEKSNECYGCRGAAYNMTGDYLASDPMCWENADKQDDIVSLPISVEALIPQKAQMRVIDNLLSIGERSATTNVAITIDMPFVSEQGILDDCVYMEMMAQSIAAMSGYKKNGNGKNTKGFLLGAKKLNITGSAAVNDLLEISVYKAAKFDDFGIIEGTITKNNQIIASGEIKVWETSDTTA